MSKKKVITYAIIAVETLLLLVCSASCFHKHQQVKELIEINQELTDRTIKQ